MSDSFLMAVLMVGLSAALYPGLRRWRKKRRAAWEMEQAEWREWSARP